MVVCSTKWTLPPFPPSNIQEENPSGKYMHPFKVRFDYSILFTTKLSLENAQVGPNVRGENAMGGI